MGMQTILSNVVGAVTLSHLELERRFDGLLLTEGKDLADCPVLIDEELRIEEGCSNKDKSSEKDVVKLLGQTFILCSHQERMVSRFSSLILLISSFYLICITLFSYGSLAVLVDDMNILKTVSTMTHTLLFLYYLFTFGVICFLGQDLMDRQRNTSNALSRVYHRFKHGWSQETKGYAKFVKSKIESPIGLSPYSFFTLDRSGFLSTMALIVTYLIVLLQFKVSE